MGKVTTGGTMSLDGYIAGPEESGLVSGLPAGGPFRAENGAGCPLTSLLYGR
jgi:hypothetical protein